MKNVGRITRTAHQFGFALLLAGCADHQPTSPDVGPKLGPAAVGSIVQSSVVTATTFCGPSGKCSTSTRYSEISEKVGRTASLRAAMGIAVGEGQTGPPNPPRPAGALKNLHVSGRTLYGDAANSDGKNFHFEITNDAAARGKVAAMRVFLDGKPLLAFDAKWKDVSGVSYREHTALTMYHEGHLAVHQEKSFIPRAVLAPDPSDRSAATLTPSFEGAVCMAGGPEPCPPDSCPYNMPVCDWFRSYTPVGLLDYFINTFESVTIGIANFFNSVWSGASPNTSAEIAETVALAMEAVNEPNIYSIAVTIGALAGGSITSALIDTLAVDMEEWVMGFLVM